MKGSTIESTDTRQAVRVSALARRVRSVISTNLSPTWVRGEISGWRRFASGHCYFTLKDADAQVRCVMFRNDAARLPTAPTEGMEAVVYAEPSFYETKGEFQLTVARLDGLGKDGLWRLAFERLKAKLLAEGLLDPARKRPLPRFPKTVGIVTSFEGAALQDILKILRRRAPWLHVIVSPTRVQGDGAAREIAVALDRLGQTGAVEVVIVARGGGSIEDLWAFNEEPVARAIARCPVPVISGVGHETDVSLADLVADVRAPTPSSAAEIVSPDLEAVLSGVEGAERRLREALVRASESGARRVREYDAQLIRLIGAKINDLRAHLVLGAEKLDLLSPLSALRRGYAVPLDTSGAVLRGAAAFTVGHPVTIRIADGSVDCTVDRVRA